MSGRCEAFDMYRCDVGAVQKHQLPTLYPGNMAALQRAAVAIGSTASARYLPEEKQVHTGGTVSSLLLFASSVIKDDPSLLPE